jgi:hypothetical protein
MYVAETAPAHLRGMLLCVKEAALTGGMLCGYLVGFPALHQLTILGCPARGWLKRN